MINNNWYNYKNLKIGDKVIFLGDEDYIPCETIIADISEHIIVMFIIEHHNGHPKHHYTGFEGVKGDFMTDDKKYICVTSDEVEKR